MRRLLVIGCPGAGKSTFARALGARMDLPVIPLDRMFWRPGWRKKDPAAFDAELADVLAGDAWIIDGPYTRTLPVRLRRADAVIWLRPPRWRGLARAAWRAGRKAERPDMAPGCPERWDAAFLRVIWTFERRPAPRLEAALAAAGAAATTRRSPREAADYLSAVGNDGRGGCPT